MKRLVVVFAAMAVAVLVAGGVAFAASFIGTDGPDNYTGTVDDDSIIGGDGNDTLSGMQGNDAITGGDGNDDLFGANEDQTVGGGRNTVKGDAGADQVVGGSGADELRGGLDNDTMLDGPEDDAAVDEIYGGDGNDDITSANVPASRDVVDCGAGTDEVVADKLDAISATCENVGELLNQEQTQTETARYYADDHNVSVAEALRRLSLEEDASVLGAELEDNEPGTFGDLYIQHEPGFRVVANFTQNGEQTIQPYVQGTPLETVVEVRQVDATLPELREDQAQAISAYESQGITIASDIDVMQNRVEVIVDSEDQAQRRQAIQAANAGLPEGVEVIVSDDLGEPEAIFFGGLKLSIANNPNLYCTSGFTVRSKLNGDEGTLTAGHCPPYSKKYPNDDRRLWYGGDSMPFVQQDLNGSQDLQWHKTPGYDDRVYIRGGKDFLYPIYRTNGRKYQRKGRTVCKYGKTTGLTCGKIVGKEYKPPWVKQVNGTFIRVRREDHRNLSSGGDSGGPWFDGNTALGIHSGPGYYGDDSVYTAINYAEDSFLDIKVQKR